MQFLVNLGLLDDFTIICIHIFLSSFVSLEVYRAVGMAKGVERKEGVSIGDYMSQSYIRDNSRVIFFFVSNPVEVDIALLLSLGRRNTEYKRNNLK